MAGAAEGIAAQLDRAARRLAARGVLLDVPGVLLRARAAPAERFRRAAAAAGLTFRQERVAAALAVADRWWDQPGRRQPSTTGREWEDWVCYYGLALQELGIDPEEGAVEAVAARARADGWWEPVPGLAAALEDVRRRGWVGVLSNALPATRGALERAGLAPLLDCCLLGPELGWRLPAAAGYLAGVAALGVAPGEATFVTASATLAEGARRAGLAAVVLELGADPAP